MSTRKCWWGNYPRTDGQLERHPQPRGSCRGLSLSFFLVFFSPSLLLSGVSLFLPGFSLSLLLLSSLARWSLCRGVLCRFLSLSFTPRHGSFLSLFLPWSLFFSPSSPLCLSCSLSSCLSLLLCHSLPPSLADSLNDFDLYWDRGQESQWETSGGRTKGERGEGGEEGRG